MFAVTGATGNLGRLAVESLLRRAPAGGIVALVRDPARAANLAAQGVTVRQADYNRPETLPAALAGVTRLLLVSGNEVGQRVRQHQAVIDAAVAARVRLVAYTSILHADRSEIGLAVEHRATEELLTESGVPYLLLRNGWYSENYVMAAQGALQEGVMIGATGSGRLSLASRADYAEGAAAALIAGETMGGRVLEFAGDEGLTRQDLCNIIGELAGKTVLYQNMSEADYSAAMTQIGLPAPIAAMLAQSDAAASRGALFDDSHTLSKLLGRPTTPIAETLRAVIAQPEPA